MKRRLAILLVIAMILAVMIPGVSAAGAYDGKTVIIATANVKGDVDVYGKVAALKDHYKDQGAAVLLVDAGNYLQGAAAANIDRGETIYGLMDAAGYDVAAMGPREFYFGNATTGMIYHSNLHKFYTQKELYRGAEAQEYGVNAKGDVKETRPAKDPAKFSVISSNITKADGYYDFDANKTFTLGSFKVGVYALTDDQVAEKTGVPAALLTAETLEECEAQADAILKFAQPGAYPSVKDGGEVRNTRTRTARDAFEEWAAKAL